MIKGERNIRFFHFSIMMERAKARIIGNENAGGNQITNQEEMKTGQ